MITPENIKNLEEIKEEYLKNGYALDHRLTEFNSHILLEICKELVEQREILEILKFKIDMKN